MVTARSLIRALVPREVRNWLRSPVRAFRWTLGEIKYAAGVNKTLQLRPGWSFLSHPAAYDFAYHFQEDDPDQVAEFDAFISTCEARMVLLDIGAHFGLFSLAALYYGGPSARAIAVDPSPTATRILSIQAQLNKVSDRLTILQASVGNHCGLQSMVATGVIASGYYVTPSEHHRGSELTTTREVTLDSLAEEFHATPTHIKIDVEGSEVNVLRGGLDILSRSPAPLLFIELHNQMIRERSEDPAETLQVLSDLGYETFGIDELPLNKDAILRRPLIRVIARRSA